MDTFSIEYLCCCCRWHNRNLVHIFFQNKDITFGTKANHLTPSYEHPPPASTLLFGDYHTITYPTLISHEMVINQNNATSPLHECCC